MLRTKCKRMTRWFAKSIFLHARVFCALHLLALSRPKRPSKSPNRPQPQKMTTLIRTESRPGCSAPSHQSRRGSRVVRADQVLGARVLRTMCCLPEPQSAFMARCTGRRQSKKCLVTSEAGSPRLQKKTRPRAFATRSGAGCYMGTACPVYSSEQTTRDGHSRTSWRATACVVRLVASLGGGEGVVFWQPRTADVRGGV